MTCTESTLRSGTWRHAYSPSPKVTGHSLWGGVLKELPFLCSQPGFNMNLPREESPLVSNAFRQKGPLLKTQSAKWQFLFSPRQPDPLVMSFPRDAWAPGWLVWGLPPAFWSLGLLPSEMEWGLLTEEHRHISSLLPTAGESGSTAQRPGKGDPP